MRDGVFRETEVCLTASKLMALLYGIKHFEYIYGYTRDVSLYCEEYFSGARYMREKYPESWAMAQEEDER